MLVSVKRVAEVLNVSIRTVQIRFKSGLYSGTKNGRKILIDTTSLPSEFQANFALAPTSSNTVNIEAKDILNNDNAKANNLLRIIANKPGSISKMKWIEFVAKNNDVSVGYLNKIQREFKQFGIGGKPRQTRTATAWSEEALEWLKGFYLSTIKRYGSCTKKAAYKALVKQAKISSWKVGSQSSAYEYFKTLHPLLESYAKGGRRAIDNFFYIKRDCDLLNPMQIVIGDQHIFDFWIADYDQGLIRRPECYLWLDMCTKLIYGIAFDKKYSSQTVKESLRLGLHRFGAFDCTYNDNGTSEKSKYIKEMIDDFHKLQMDAKDVAELYRQDDGSYAILDENDDVIETVDTAIEWNKKHKRIYAQVKNAKAKDIERFFRTLEGRLRDRRLPGAVATLAGAADINEVEMARLNRQKDNGELLTEEQFIKVVIQEIEAYENEVHQTLKMTPLEKIQEKIKLGWKPTFFDTKVIDLLCSDKQIRKVSRARVLVNGNYYIGEQLTSTNGRLDDVGLSAYEGKKIEVRYSKYDDKFAYAIINGEPRSLRKVEGIAMLDEEAMVNGLKAKKEQIRAVRTAFLNLTSVSKTKALEHPLNKAIEMAEKQAKELPVTFDGDLKEEVSKRIEESTTPTLKLHASSYERYKWCLDMLIANKELSDKDKEFIQKYELTSEYSKQEEYWKNYKKLGGIA